MMISGCLFFQKSFLNNVWINAMATQDSVLHFYHVFFFVSVFVVFVFVQIKNDVISLNALLRSSLTKIKIVPPLEM